MIEKLSTLSWVDYLIIAGVIRGAYVGYRDGILHELVRLCVIALTFFAAIRLSPPLAQLINLHTVFGFTFAKSLSVFLIGTLTFVALGLTTGLLLRFLDIGKTVFFRAIGLLVGVARWVFILSIVFMLIMHSGVGTLGEDVMEKSHWGASIAEVAPTTLEFLSAFVS